MDFLLSEVEPTYWRERLKHDLNKDATSGIHAVKADNTANGTVIAREYYGINGQRLGRLLLKGVYLEKIITTNGVKTVKRVK